MQTILANVHLGAALVAAAGLYLAISEGNWPAAANAGAALLLALGIHVNLPGPTPPA